MSWTIVPPQPASHRNVMKDLTTLRAAWAASITLVEKRVFRQVLTKGLDSPIAKIRLFLNTKEEIPQKTVGSACFLINILYNPAVTAWKERFTGIFWHATDHCMLQAGVQNYPCQDCMDSWCRHSMWEKGAMPRPDGCHLLLLRSRPWKTDRTHSIPSAKKLTHIKTSANYFVNIL